MKARSCTASRSVGLLLALALAAAGCGAASVSRLHEGSPGDSADETNLRNQAAHFDDVMTKADLVVHDDKLQLLLDSVAARLLTAQQLGAVKVRVHIVRSPFLNAYALPNGSIYLNTGLLATIENEDQLAGVMSHELEHYVDKHALRQQRSDEQRETLLLVSAVLLASMRVPVAAYQGSSSMLAAQSQGYRRDLESQADTAAIDSLISAGYDPGQYARLLELLAADESEADVKDPCFYADHPATLDRLRASKERLAHNGTAATQTGPRDPRAYDAAVADVLLLNAKDDAALHRFDHAERAVGRHLAVRPDSAIGYFTKGEVLRRKAGGNGQARTAALAAYRRATELDPAGADAQREYGLMLREDGRDAEARAALRRYLVLAPKAVDRGIIESYLK